MTEKLQKELTLTVGQLTAICGTFLIPGLVAVFMFASRFTTLETKFGEHVDAARLDKQELLKRIDDGDATNAKAIGENNLKLDGIGTQVGNVRVDVARIAASTR